MESARTVVSAVRLAEGSSKALGATKSSLDAGGAKLKKPTGLAIALRSVVDDGGGESKTESVGQLGAARVDVTLRKGSKQPQAAAETFVANKTTVRTSKNGRGLTSNSNSLLLKRRRLKRNLSAAATTAATSAVSAGGGKMNSASSSSSLHTRSLDRKTLLRHRQNMQLQPSDRQWVRADLHRGSIQVHDKLTPSYPRPVLCTLETTAGEIASRLSQLSSKSGSVVRLVGKTYPTTDLNGNCNGKYNFNHPLCKHNENGSSGYNHLSSPRRSEYRGRQADQPGDRLRLLLLDKDDGHRPEFDITLYSSDTQSDDNILHHSLADFNSNINADTPNDDDSERRFNGNDICRRNSGSDVESSAFDDLSSGARLSEHRDSLSDDMILGTDASALSPTFDSATEGLDTYGSSSDELEHDCPSSITAPDSCPQDLSKYPNGKNNSGNSGIFGEHLNDRSGDTETDSRLEPQFLGSMPPSSSSSSLSRACSTGNTTDTQDPDCHPGSEETRPASENDATPALYVQLHGEAARRLGRDERPLQIQNDFLFKLGFKDPWRVQEEGMNTELGSLLRFYAGKYNPKCSEQKFYNTRL